MTSVLYPGYEGMEKKSDLDCGGNPSCTARYHRKIILSAFAFLAIGNLPTLFRNPGEYLIALVVCFFLSVAIVKILF